MHPQSIIGRLGDGILELPMALDVHLMVRVIES